MICTSCKTLRCNMSDDSLKRVTVAIFSPIARHISKSVLERENLAISLTIYRVDLGISATEVRKKVSKRVPGASRRGGAPKVRKRVENGVEKT